MNQCRASLLHKQHKQNATKTSNMQPRLYRCRIVVIGRLDNADADGAHPLAELPALGVRGDQSGLAARVEPFHARRNRAELERSARRIARRRRARPQQRRLYAHTKRRGTRGSRSGLMMAWGGSRRGVGAGCWAETHQRVEAAALEVEGKRARERGGGAVELQLHWNACLRHFGLLHRLAREQCRATSAHPAAASDQSHHEKGEGQGQRCSAHGSRYGHHGVLHRRCRRLRWR